MNLLHQIRTYFEQQEEKRYHKRALKFMRKRYKEEIASQRISEDYLTDMITNYPAEDQRKGKMRNDMVQTQSTIQNLDQLLTFLKNYK